MATVRAGPLRTSASSAAAASGSSRSADATLITPNATACAPARSLALGRALPARYVSHLAASTRATPAGVCRAAAGSKTEAAEGTAYGPGRSVYRPATYAEMIEDSVNATIAGLDAGLTKMEIEFPPLPNSISSYEGKSDDYIDSNIQYAIQAGKLLYEKKGMKTHVVMPDAVELRRATKKFGSSMEFAEGVTTGSLSEVTGATGDDTLFTLKSIFTGEQLEDTAEVAVEADMYIVINVSTIELPSVEKYMDEVAKGKPVILFNLELDTLRADLGMFGFPSKDVHFGFLSSVKPMFYLRQRDYSKSVAVAPFILNYSGAIFREFPGPWQVMLKQDSGELCCIAEREVRYTLNEAKEEMLQTMGLNTEEEGSAEYFLRRGYKRMTWWEEEENGEKSRDWRL